MTIGEHAVFEIRDSFALRLAQSALGEAGIPYVSEAEDPQYLPGVAGASGIGATPLWKCACRIRVPAEMRARARELLEPLLDDVGDSPAE